MKPKLPSFVKNTLAKFQENNFQIYIVGGAVRDLLTKRKVSDWDFTTNATPEQILKIFPDGFYDNRFGTVGVADKSKPKKKVYEITTFRKEIGYSDKRHPDKVSWGKRLDDDLARRDFTINAMAWGSAPTPQIIDPFGGRADLDKKIVRAVGNPNKRFTEDALRMMRAVRIATEINFTIETQTLKSIKKNANLINKIAKERIKDEFFKILASDFPAKGVALLRETGLLKQILPELEKAFEIPQKSPGRHHLWDVGTHSLRSLEFCPSPDPLVRLATLIHDLGKVSTFKKLPNKSITFYNHELVSTSIARRLSARFRLSKKESQRLIILVRWHQFTCDERQTDSAIRRFIRHVGRENIKDMLALRVGDRLGGGARETSWRLEKFKKRLIEVQKQPFSVADLKVGGNDVIRTLSISPGPIVGKILNQLFQEVAKDKKRNEKKHLLKRIREIGKTL